MNIELFFQGLIAEWGEREVYSIDTELIEPFLSNGAELISRKDNGDGTITTTLTFCGKRFLSISIEHPPGSGIS